MANYPLPDDDRLFGLIKETFDTLPGPEMARLNQFEQRLNRKLPDRKSISVIKKIPWWVVLMFGCSVVAATWWAGDILNNQKPVQVEEILPVESNDIEQTNNPDQRSINSISPTEEDHLETNYDDDSPIIYQRENF